MNINSVKNIISKQKFAYIELRENSNLLYKSSENEQLEDLLDVLDTYSDFENLTVYLKKDCKTPNSAKVVYNISETHSSTNALSVEKEAKGYIHEKNVNYLVQKKLDEYNAKRELEEAKAKIEEQTEKLKSFGNQIMIIVEPIINKFVGNMTGVHSGLTPTQGAITEASNEIDILIRLKNLFSDIELEQLITALESSPATLTMVKTSLTKK